MPPSSRVTLKFSDPNGDLRLSEQGRLNALRDTLAHPRLAELLKRATRWATLGTRCDAGFAALVLPDKVRLMAAHGLELERNTRKIPNSLKLLLPKQLTQFRAQSDLEPMLDLLELKRAPGFYAAVPLRAYGYTLGVLGVIHAQPRQLDPAALALLEDLTESLKADFEQTEEPAPQPQSDEARHGVRSLGQMLPVLLLALDARGSVRRAEGQSLSRLRLSPRGLLGVSAFELFAAEPLMLQAITRALGGETLQVRLEWHERMFHVWLVPETGGGVSALALDITDFQRGTRDNAAPVAF